MEFSVWDLTDFLFHTLATRGKLIASLLNSTLNLGCVRLTLFWKKDKWKTGVPEYVSAFQAFCSRKQNARNNPEYTLWLHFLFEYEYEKIKSVGNYCCEHAKEQRMLSKVMATGQGAGILLRSQTIKNEENYRATKLRGKLAESNSAAQKTNKKKTRKNPRPALDCQSINGIIVLLTYGRNGYSPIFWSNPEYSLDIPILE